MVLKRMIKPSVACLVLVLSLAGLYSTVVKYYGQRGRGTIKNLNTKKHLITSKRQSVKLEVAPRRTLHQQHVDTTGRLAVDQHLSKDTEARHHHQSTGDGGAEPQVGTTAPRAGAGPPPINLDQRDVDVDELFRRLVVVTAFSENHRLEGMGLIGTVQREMPATRIIVYDIGIDPATIPIVKSLCNVEVRPFKFDRYPLYVSNIFTYAWKVIIIKESLNEFGAIFWADSSVRFTRSVRTLLPFAKQHHGYLSRIHSYRLLMTRSRIPHNYFFTQQKMFDYFSITRPAYALSSYTPHLAANRQLLINSTAVQDRLIRPMYECALNEICISPPGSMRGNHQFDAAALMLVIHKYWPGEFNRKNDHAADFDKTVYMHRLSDDWYIAHKCLDS